MSSLDSSEAFYHQMLGFDIISKVEGRHIFFRVGGQVLLCFIAEATKAETELPAHYASGKQHIAFEVSPDQYEAWKEKLLDDGVEVTHEQLWKPGVSSFYFEDPDGHVLEILPPGLWD